MKIQASAEGSRSAMNPPAACDAADDLGDVVVHLADLAAQYRRICGSSLASVSAWIQRSTSRARLSFAVM